MRNHWIQCMRNLVVTDAHGHRYPIASQEWYEVVMLMGGPACLAFVANVFAGPHVRTVQKWITRDSHQMDIGFTEANFVHLAQMYAKAMTQLGIKFGTIPTLLAEDESKIQPGAALRPSHEDVVGHCGLQCANQCPYVTRCMCGPTRHHCAADGYSIPVGRGDRAYDDLSAAFKKSRLASYARALVANPLHFALPRLCVAFLPTCNAFTADDYVKPQWDRVQILWDKYLRHVLGPLIGHSSDGDSRRRKLFLLECLRRIGDRYGLDTPTFTYTAAILIDPSTGEKLVRNLCDTCFIHNAKKGINGSALASKKLMLGPNNLACLSFLLPVFHNCLQHEHGARASDLNRTGFNSMDWPSCQRLLTPRFLGCVDRLTTAGFPELAATRRWLGILSKYTGVFLSQTKTVSERVKACGFIAGYLTNWRAWVVRTPGMTLAENFITTECYLDMMISVHFAVNLFRYFRDYTDGLECPMHIVGSDCCEQCFCKIGGAVFGTRVWTFDRGLISLQKFHLMATAPRE